MLYLPSKKIDAEVAELAYASVSKTDFLTDMRVQLPPSAPHAQILTKQNLGTWS